jgi:short-subunit dehydrogenase
MERVLILGATSAIAAEVARIHANRGDRLHLVGRTPEKLSQVVRSCRMTETTSRVADLGRLESLEALVHESVDALGGLDRVLVAHGDLGNQLLSEASFEHAEEIFRLNLLSQVALLVPLANVLEREGRGRIGVITSVAGERGRPRNFTYGSAKGALSIYLQGLRSRLYPLGVSVTNLKLGPVDTPMTKDHAKNPLFAKPQGVAQGIVEAMDARKHEAFVPGIWAAIMPIVKMTPEALFQRVSALSGR